MKIYFRVCERDGKKDLVDVGGKRMINTSRKEALGDKFRVKSSLGVIIQAKNEICERRSMLELVVTHVSAKVR